MERVDLFQFHNAIVDTTSGADFAADAMLDEVVPAFERLREQGKFRFFGITARRRDPGAAPGRRCARLRHRAGQLQSPEPEPRRGGAAGYPAQDYGNLLAIRRPPIWGSSTSASLAGGALCGSEERHPLGSPPPGADRLGRQLQHRCRARPPAPAAGRRGPCRQPDRGRACGTSSPTRRSRPCWSAIRRWSTSNTPQRRSTRDRFPPRRWRVRRNCSADLPARRGREQRRRGRRPRSPTVPTRSPCTQSCRRSSPGRANRCCLRRSRHRGTSGNRSVRPSAPAG